MLLNWPMDNFGAFAIHLLNEHNYNNNHDSDPPYCGLTPVWKNGKIRILAAVDLVPHR